MPTVLTDTEARVLASLVEKQMTTPEYYPLTLNALVQACNQKTNREPVVAYDEQEVSHALETLRDKNLVYVFYGSTSRVPKYKHMMKDVYEIGQAESALVTVLMLRGAQTVGELRERAGRLHDFPSSGEVEETLNSLMTRDPSPLVTRLPRQHGQKEARYVHLLTGDVGGAHAPDDDVAAHKTASRRADDERLAELEREVKTLGEQVQELRHQLEEFKAQFG